MIKIETVAELVEHGYSVSTFCPTCHRHGPTLDLQKYIDGGRGHLRPAQLKARHKYCRTILQLTIRPAKGYGK